MTYAPGYRYPETTVDQLADVLVNGMDNETLYGGDEAVHARLAGGYVLRQDPRSLAQDVLDHLADLVDAAYKRGRREAAAEILGPLPVSDPNGDAELAEIREYIASQPAPEPTQWPPHPVPVHELARI